MKKILIVFGTRPEAIKMTPLVKAFQQHTDSFETKVCVTAQHRESRISSSQTVAGCKKKHHL